MIKCPGKNILPPVTGQLSGKRYEEALGWLKKSCDIAAIMGYDEFLVVEGKKATMLMEYAISKGLEVERFRRIIERLRLRRCALLRD